MIRISVPSRDERALAETFGAHLAPGGLQLPTSQPYAIGDAVDFELASRDGSVLFAGHGAVSRVIEGAGPAGRTLLIRFTHLDGPQRATLDRLLLHKAGLHSLGLPTSPDATRAHPSPRPVPFAVDVGGSFARAALIRGGRPTLVPLGPNTTALPTAVAVDERERLVFGLRARTRLAAEPQSGIASPLPLLLLDPRSATDRLALERLPFTVRDSDQGPLADLPHHPSPATQLFAAVLAELKDHAQALAGQPLPEAHLAIASTLDARSRHLLQLALRRAGISSPVLVDSALAAAAFHGFFDAAPPGPLLVIDWGGTRLHLTLLSPLAGELEVVAAASCPSEGSAAVDEDIARTLVAAVERDLGAPLSNPLARQRLVDAAESIRIALSTQPEVRVRIPFLAMDDAGNPVDLDLALDADTTLKPLEPALDQLLRAVHALLESVRCDPATVYRVLPVGGLATWSRLTERLEERFHGRVASASGAPGAVVLGAVHIAAARQRPARNASALEEPVSVLGAGGELFELFPQGTTLPARTSLLLQPRAGVGIFCPFVEGAALANGSGYVGALALPGARGEVRLTAHLDARRVLDIDLAGDRGLHAHGRFALPSAGPGIEATVLAELPLPGEPEPSAATALGRTD